MKTYPKEAVILLNNQEYQMKFDARIQITNIETTTSINVLHKADEEQNWGIIEENLKAGFKKGADTLVAKGKIKPFGGSCELLVWY